jgi:serine/threonine protein kinase HipA of HipAB toxin-antitoxin module
MEETLKELFKNVKYRMREEGIHYCFNHYSDWTEIKDEEFHRLRQQYLCSIEELQNYINKRIEDYENI